MAGGGRIVGSVVFRGAAVELEHNQQRGPLAINHADTVIRAVMAAEGALKAERWL